MCTDAFEEPAVGAIYVSNYRIIFHGNLISVSLKRWAVRGGDTLKSGEHAILAGAGAGHGRAWQGDVV